MRLGYYTIIKYVLTFVVTLSTIHSDNAFALELDIPSAKGYVIPKSKSFEASFRILPKIKAILKIRARIDYANGGAGSNTVMELLLNNQRIEATKSRGLGRLLNKNLYSHVGSTIMGNWYQEGNWRLLYQSSFTTNATFYEGDPFTTELDVTDMLRDDGLPNQLLIQNHVCVCVTDCPIRPTNTNENIIIDKVSLDYQTDGVSSTLLLSMLPPSMVIKDGTTQSTPAAYTLTKHQGGGFSLKVGSKNWDFTTALSFPNAGFNMLDQSETTGFGEQVDWKVNMNPLGLIKAIGSTYRVDRTIRTFPEKVTISDTITNTQQIPLGLIVRNEVSLKGVENTPVRLAGSGDLVFNGRSFNDYYSPGNPTVYAESTDHGIGIIAEDDVYRNQAKLYVNPGYGGTPMAGIKTEMLRLPPGESYTLVWSVYPVQGNDYFDFINLVRKNWDSNILTDGPWLWGYTGDLIYKSSPYLSVLEKPAYKIKYGVHGSWVDFREPIPRKLAFGAAMFDDVWESYRAQVTSGNNLIREETNNRVKTLVYFDEQRDSGFKSINKPCENDSDLYPDSKLTNKEGKQECEPWNNKDGIAQFEPAYGVVPITGTTFGNNSFGSKMLSLPARYRSDLNADGIYIDEFEDVGYGFPRLTYNKSDNHTCLLNDSSLSISTDQVGLTQLLSKEHHEQLILAAQNFSKTPNILANGPSYVRSTMSIQRMVEAQHNNVWPYQGNLQTPLGYMAQGTSFSDIQRLLTFGLLPVGTVSQVQKPPEKEEENVNDKIWLPMALMFPTTPIELHMGYIYGKERIITSHAGIYGWPKSYNLVRADYFSADGSPKMGDYSNIVEPNGVTTQVNMSTATRAPVQNSEVTSNGSYEGDMAILRKVPITVNCLSCIVSKLVYAPKSVSMSITGLDKYFSINMRNGEFPIKPGSAFNVRFGKISKVIFASAIGDLKIDGITEYIKITQKSTN